MTNSTEGNYNSLDLDHKKEFLMNQSALLLVVDQLAFELKCDREKLVRQVWQLAYEMVRSLSETELHETINYIEANHLPFDQRGAVVEN